MFKNLDKIDLGLITTILISTVIFIVVAIKSFPQILENHRKLTTISAPSKVKRVTKLPPLNSSYRTEDFCLNGIAYTKIELYGSSKFSVVEKLNMKGENINCE